MNILEKVITTIFCCWIVVIVAMHYSQPQPDDNLLQLWQKSAEQTERFHQDQKPGGILAPSK